MSDQTYGRDDKSLHPKQLLETVNESGFPFQLFIETQIESTKTQHLWETDGREVPWVDKITGESGYIDLVLRQGDVRLVIECKRVKQGAWIFLIPTRQANSRARIRILSNSKEPFLGRLIGWQDFNSSPPSFESSFCVMRRQGNKDSLRLENISATLLRSVESLSPPPNESIPPGTTSDHRVFAAAIVTNSELWVCRFEPEDVSIPEGEIPNDKAEFEQVDYIRFRKPILTNYSLYPEAERVYGPREQESDRTVLIVQAKALLDFLRRFPG